MYNNVKNFWSCSKKKDKMKMSKKNFQDELFCQKKNEILYLDHNALNTKNMILLLLPTF
jgi:hypothetical protein